MGVVCGQQVCDGCGSDAEEDTVLCSECVAEAEKKALAEVCAWLRKESARRWDNGEWSAAADAIEAGDWRSTER